ncbi:MAG TPA: hypothetical protein VHH34_17100 [Pseudonocardiaceae bacterium]|nr:hypothetical protein [Pseudonocardiaceae bacterium]
MLVTTTLTCGIAIVVNLATEWKTNGWAWLTVGVLTLMSAATSLWLLRRQNASSEGTGRSAQGGIDVTMGRRWEARNVRLESTGSNSLRAGPRAHLQDLTMRAGLPNRGPDDAEPAAISQADQLPQIRE